MLESRSSDVSEAWATGVTVQIDPPTTPKWYPMTLTARRSHRRKPREVHRNLPQTQTLSGTADAHPHARKHGGAQRFLNNTIRDIDSRRKSLQRATKSGDILYVTNVLTGVVHLAITAPTEADSSRSMEHNKRQLQTAPVVASSCQRHAT